MSKIGIIGLGKIGSSLAFEFLFDKDIEEIHLYNRNKSKLEALITSLKIASHQVNKNTLVSEIDFNRVNELDLIIISIKDNYDPRLLLTSNNYPKWLPKNLRYSGLPLDFPLIFDITNKIKAFNGIVAVITNPVEMTTQFISETLNSKKVVGLGASIDSARISYMLYETQNTKIRADNIILFGEHGFKLKIVQSLSADICKDGSCQEIIDTSTSIGFNIVKKIGYTLLDCIPSFIKDIYWLLNKESSTENYRSFAYFDGINTLSQPIKINNSNNSIELYTDYSNSELQIVNEMKLTLNNQYELIFEELKNAAANNV
jgi:malate/lactate dehydrogenase